VSSNSTHPNPYPSIRLRQKVIMAILDYIMSFFLERKKDDNVNWIVTIKSALLNKKKTGQMREKEWKKGK